MEEFANRLKIAKYDRGLSIKKLSDLVGIDIKNVGQYERGEVIPTAVTLLKLADAMNVSIDWLYDRKKRYRNPKIED